MLADHTNGRAPHRPAPDRASGSDVNGFDAAAPSYDRDFTNTTLGRLLREAVHTELAKLPPGSHVLELGCGTGEDATWLAERGHQVTAVDGSVAMLRVTAEKAAALNVTMHTHQVDLRRPGSALHGELHDAAFSNFGPLNCVEDRRAVAAWLAARLRPGSLVIAVVMGPLCPWEWLWHGLHGDLTAATRRLRGRSNAHVGGGGHVEVYYPSARTLRRELQPWFDHMHTRGIGVLLPPSEVAHVVDALPRLFTPLAKLERAVDRSILSRWFNDHYLSVFVRR